MVYCLPPVVVVVDKRRTRQESGGGVFQVHVVCGAFEEVDVALILSRTIELSIIFLWCVLTCVVCFDGSGTESSCFEGREVLLQTFAEASLRVKCSRGDTNQRSGHPTVVMHHKRLHGPSMVFSIARQHHIKIKSNLAFPLSTSVPWLGCDFVARST